MPAKIYNLDDYRPPAKRYRVDDIQLAFALAIEALGPGVNFDPDNYGVVALDAKQGRNPNPYSRPGDKGKERKK